MKERTGVENIWVFFLTPWTLQLLATSSHQSISGLQLGRGGIEKAVSNQSKEVNVESIGNLNKVNTG